MINYRTTKQHLINGVLMYLNRIHPVLLSSPGIHFGAGVELLSSSFLSRVTYHQNLNLLLLRCIE